MINLNGSDWQSKFAGGVGDYTRIYSGDINSRRAIHYLGTSGANIQFRDWSVFKSRGSLTLAGATYPRALCIDAHVCFRELSIASGGNSYFLYMILWSGYGGLGTAYIKLLAYNTGSGYQLVLAREFIGGGTTWAVLGTIAADSVYHRATAYIFLDRCYTAFDGSDFTETVFSAAQDGDMYPGHIDLLFSSGFLNPAFDALRIDIDPYVHAATVGKSMTNGNGDNGVMYAIAKSVIEGAINTGGAFAMNIVDGEFTDSVTGGADYLMAKVGNDNDIGFAVKMSKALGGTWSKKNWSIT